MKEKFSIKNKICTFILKSGKKDVSEKIFKKTTKKLQRSSKKNSNSIITTAIFLTMPAFKIWTFTRKKRKKKL